MENKPEENNKQVEITIGNITGTSGNFNVAGGNITTHTTTTTTSGLSAAEINQLFDKLYTSIETRPDTAAVDKEDLKTDLKEIQTTVMEAVKQEQQVDENFLSRRFRNIARTAPDILDVIVTTLANPLAGLGIVAAKIAKKAKEETGTA
jgi:hypothetical protein